MKHFLKSLCNIVAEGFVSNIIHNRMTLNFALKLSQPHLETDMKFTKTKHFLKLVIGKTWSIDSNKGCLGPG